MTKKISPEWLLIIGLALIKLLIHLLTNTNYELHRDAFLYYSLGEHLDWGYLSVPPLIAVISKVSIFLFGKTVFALRFFPALIGSISVIIVGLIITELGGKFRAILTGCLAFILSPAFLGSNNLFQPVSFNQFFWLLSGLIIVKLLKSQNTRFWIYLGITWGIAFLNKYSIAFFGVSFLAAMLLTPHRTLLFSKHFLYGMFLGLIIISPNLYWQYSHNWPVINHLEELSKFQFVHVNSIDFIIDQFIRTISTFWVWLAAFLILLYNKNERNYRVIAFTFIILIIILLKMGGKSYYTIGIYSILFAFGGYFLEKYLTGKLMILNYLLLVLMVIVLIPISPYALPIYSLKKMAKYAKETARYSNSMPLRWEDGEIHNLPQDYADMTGWEELANIVIDTYQKLPDESKRNCAIYAEEYCTAGAILFYGKELGLPEPISFSDNFLLWAPDSLNQKVLIYVNDELGDVEWLFENSELSGQVNNKYFREDGVQVYLCTHPNDNFPSFYAEKVAELKNKFR